MAEEYRRSLLGTTGSNLEYSNIEEGVRSSRRMQDRLSQLSQFAFRDLTEQATRQGQEYAVKNRPSLKQIGDAVRKGEDVKALFAQPGTVFGDNARVMQAELFRQDVSQNLNNRIADVINAVDRGMYEGDANEFADSIQAEIDGIYNVLADIDPQAGLKFKAHGVTLSNTVYEKILGKQTEQFIAEKEAAVETQKQAYATLLSANLVKTNGNFAQAVALTMSVKQDLFDAYDALPSGITDASYNDVMALEQEVYKNSATSIIQNNPMLRNNFDDVYYNLMNNTPPEQLDFYRYLPETTKLEIVQQVKDMHAQNYDIATKTYALEERNNKSRLAVLKSEWQDLQDTTDLDDPNRQEKLYQIEAEVEMMSKTHPSVVNMIGWRKYKDGEFEEINRFDPDATEIRRMIDNQEFADWSSLEEYAIKTYPYKFTSIDEVEATFGEYFLNENKRYISAVADDIVNNKMFAYYTTTDKRDLHNKIVRQVKNTINTNTKLNQQAAEGEPLLTTDAKEIANELLKRTEQVKPLDQDIFALQSSMQDYVTKAKIMKFNTTDPDFVMNEKIDKILKNTLDKDEYTDFMTLYQQLLLKRQEVIDLGYTLF